MLIYQRVYELVHHVGKNLKSVDPEEPHGMNAL
jgi:hypothetical protein